MFSRNSFSPESFDPASWSGENVVTPAEISGAASLSIAATGVLTVPGACSSWAGTWQGQWQGEWGGCIEDGPPGSMSGAATLSITASGTLTSGSIVDTIFAGGGGGSGSRRRREERQRAADEHEQRIRRQNETVLAFVMSAVTEGCL